MDYGAKADFTPGYKEAGYNDDIKTGTSMKLLYAPLLLASATLLSAYDFDYKMGLGSYYTGAEGKVEYVQESFEGSYADATLTTSSQFYLWGVLDLKNSYLPKARFEYLKIAAEGDSKAHLQSADPEIQQLIDDYINNNGAIDLNDQNWNSYLQQDIYDLSLYYEFFEKSAFPTVALGLGYKYFEYIYIMDIHYVPGMQFGDRGSSGAPYAYLGSRYDMPSINMGVEGNAKLYLFGQSQMYDWQLKMDLMFDFDEETRGGLEFGYREQYFSLEGNDVDNVTGDMIYKGIFAGFVINFK